MPNQSQNGPHASGCTTHDPRYRRGSGGYFRYAAGGEVLGAGDRSTPTPGSQVRHAETWQVNSLVDVTIAGTS